MYIQLKWGYQYDFIIAKDKTDQPLVELKDMVSGLSEYTILPPGLYMNDTVHDDIIKYLNDIPFLSYTRIIDKYLIINLAFGIDYIIKCIQDMYVIGDKELESLYNKINSMKVYIRELIINDMIV